MKKTKANLLVFSFLFFFSPLILAGNPNVFIVSDTASKAIRVDQLFKNKKEIQEYFNAETLKAFKNGYLAYSLDSLNFYDDSLCYAYVHQGSLFVWGDLRWGIKEGILLKSGLSPKEIQNQPANPEELFWLYEKIIGYYENNGYPFVSVKLDSISFNKDTIGGKLSIVLGKRITFDTLALHGEHKISRGFLQQYLEISPGDAYNDKLLSEISKKLKELPYLVEFQKNTVEFEGQKAIVHLYINKKSANFFNGVVGVLPNSPTLQTQNNSSNLLITGDVKLTLLNSFKYGEKVDFAWRRLKPQTQQLNAEIGIPYLFNTPFGVNEQLDLLKQDTSFVNFSNNLGVLYAISTQQQLKVFWEHKSTTALNSHLINSNENYLGNKGNFYGMSFTWEKLNYRFNPSKGFRLFVSGQAGNRSLQGSEDNGKIQISLSSDNPNIDIIAFLPKTSVIYHFKGELDYYIPFFKITALKLSTKNGYIRNPYLFDNDLYRIGGFRLLRGFDEQSLFASLYSILTIEYRLLLEQNSFIALFFDQGYTQRNTFTTGENDTPYGFGASINFQTRPGIFSLSYAVGSQKGNPISFPSAKIHFGFVSLF